MLVAVELMAGILATFSELATNNAQLESRRAY